MTEHTQAVLVIDPLSDVSSLSESAGAPDITITHWGRNKMAAILQMFQIDLLEWKSSYFYSNITEVCS